MIAYRNNYRGIEVYDDDKRSNVSYIYVVQSSVSIADSERIFKTFNGEPQTKGLITDHMLIAYAGPDMLDEDIHSQIDKFINNVKS